jgi:hypothetical protein
LAFVKIIMALIDKLIARVLQLVAVIPLLALVFWIRRDKRLDKIDGPKGRLFVGLGLSLPQPASQLLREWAQQYGDIYKIKIGYYNWVVLSSPEAVKEILDKQVQTLKIIFPCCSHANSSVYLVFVKITSTDGRVGSWRHENVNHAIWPKVASISYACA